MPLGYLDRAPDARLQRAEWLARQWDDYPSTDSEDPVVSQYAEFLHALNRLPFIGKERYKKMHPVYAEVHFLAGASRMPNNRHNRQCADREAAVAQKDRAIIKALVLAAQPSKDIAAFLGFKTKAIELFEYLAFDVRHRLAERGYIHNHVLGTAVTDSTFSSDFEELILREAYLYGIDGLKRYIGVLPMEDKDLEAVQLEVRGELALKAKTAVRSMPVNSHTAVEILRDNATYRKNHQDADFRERALIPTGGMGTSRDMQENVIGLLHGIGLSVAPTAVESEAGKLPAIEHRVTKDFEKAVREVLDEEAAKAGDQADG